MIIKRYIVNNMNEAMTRIRYELGKDAIIISQRKIKKEGFLGFFAKKVIEVTAAVENEVKKTNETDLKSSLESIKKLVNNEVKIPTEPDKNKEIINEMKRSVEPKVNILNTNKDSDIENKLFKEMQEMKMMINSIKNTTNISGSYAHPKSQLHEMLSSCDLNEDISEEIISDISNLGSDLDDFTKAKEAIKNKIAISEESLEGTVVLVGPTGVGKTTTIAKLAGRLALIEKKKVGLITIDTYRIGAVEQLRTYADIMNIPFKVVITAKDMETAIDSMKGCDVILIDTTGRSSRNAMQLSELRSFVDKANTDKIHLVVSCTTKNKDIDAIVGGYKALNYNSVIITKLDETATFGSILNILKCANKPLSFVTVGQNVPDDMKRLSAEDISKLILGEDTIC
jgi:flagellar biosynthesis protein FlhF